MPDRHSSFTHVLADATSPIRAMGPKSRAGGLTIVELLVSTAVISTMMALLLPAVQASREAARNLQCQNNLHQVGMALVDHHHSHKSLPAGWTTDSTGESAFGWLPFIFPELEESGLSQELDIAGPLMPISSRLATTPAVLVCPSDIVEPTFDLFAEAEDHETHAQESQETLGTLPAASYLGVFGTTDADDVPGASGNGTFVANRNCRFAEITRGLSHVVIVGERTARKLPATWLGIALDGEDATGRLTGYCDLGPNRPDADECEFDSRHPGSVNFLWGDGHVGSVTDNIDRQLYREMARRQ